MGGGYYYWQGRNTSGFDDTKPYAISGEVGGESSQAQPMSLKDLMMGGKNQMCTLKFASGGTGVEGTVYVTGGQVRGDFTTDSAAGKVGAHMIVKDEITYSWADTYNMGFKAPVDVTPAAAGNGGVDVNSKFDYTCQAWVVDQAKFELPKEVKF